MGAQYASLGDNGFKGLNSRDNPNALPEKFLSKAQNVRLNRGIISVRKGTKRLTAAGLVGQTLFGSCVFTNTAGTDLIVLVVGDGLYTYNTATDALSAKVSFPVGQTIVSTDAVDVFQAGGEIFILRGFSKRPLKWDGATTLIVMPAGAGSYHKFPNASSGIYHGNRIIVCQSAGWDKTTGTATGNSNDEVSVSNYLDFTEFALLDVFKINDGSNDRLVGIAPWVLNEFVAFMRNRIYYCSVGVGAEAAGHAIDQTDCYVKVLATDVGCIARRSIVQAGGGMLFLADNGVYVMQPSSATTPEGMRVGVLGEPVSAPIEDIVTRINYNHASKAVAAYWENRYYLAVPLDSSTTNNCLLVFNFINKAWESVDVYQSGFDIAALHPAVYGNRRRLFAVDTEQGLFLLEELESGDEYDNTTNNAVLPVTLPFTLETTSFTRYPIAAEVITRGFNAGTSDDKRYASVELDIYAPAGGQITTSFVATNPDVTTVVDRYGSPTAEDSTRMRPVRKTSSSGQVKVEMTNGICTVRNITLSVFDPGRNLISKE